MAQADISIVTEQQLPMIVELYNQVFRPRNPKIISAAAFQGALRNVLGHARFLDNRLRSASPSALSSSPPCLLTTGSPGSTPISAARASWPANSSNPRPNGAKTSRERTNSSASRPSNRHKPMLHMSMVVEIQTSCRHLLTLCPDLLIQFEKASWSKIFL